MSEDDAAWLELIRDRQRVIWGRIAEASGGSTVEEDAFLAAIVPAAPDRSVFNSVLCDDGERLLAALEEIDAAYVAAGVNAWTVWVPEADTAVAAGLERAGHVLDAEPRAMAMALSEQRESEAGEGLELTEEYDLARLARLNEIAYGYPEGDFSPIEGEPIAGTRIYLARLEGEPVGCVMTWDHEGDCGIYWVATVPEARGRGVGRSLMGLALREARDRGLATTTLQSTRLGRPVYERLGYRDFGALQMWERRRG